MRLWFPYDFKISRAMERIRQAFIKYSPPGTLFLDQPEGDYIHCINWIGQNPKEHTSRDEVCQGVDTLPRSSRYIIFAHIGNPHYGQFQREYEDLFRNALAVITFNKAMLGLSDPNIIETPWGFEPHIFYQMRIPRRWTIITTGYDAAQEAIDSVFWACYHTMKSVVHVGGRLDPRWVQPTFTRFEGISDDHLRELYNQALYVSGLRREGGFEMPIVEGYACGCQPITFDHTGSRRWFSEFAILVPNVPTDDLTRILMGILERPVTVEPKPEILETFYWKNVMGNMWLSLIESLKRGFLNAGPMPSLTT